MRWVLIIVVLLALLSVSIVSCRQTPEYKPETFRTTIESLIKQGRYSDAVHYLRKADPLIQAQYDKGGYLAVAEDLIVLPGVYPNVEPSAGDWFFPGTQDAIEDAQWQKAATTFASSYNKHRQSQSP